MFDQKHYFIEKVINRLSVATIYKNDPRGFEKVLDSVNFGVASSLKSNLKDSVIGWVAFCKGVEQLDKNNSKFDLDEVFSIMKSNVQNVPKTQSDSPSRREDIVDESLLVEEDAETKMARLLSIASEVNVLDGFEYDELSEEGLRVTGVIERNATSLDAEDLINDDAMPYIRLNSIDDKIVSPITGSSDVFCIDDNTWMDIDTEQKFKVYYSSTSSS